MHNVKINGSDLTRQHKGLRVRVWDIFLCLTWEGNIISHGNGNFFLDNKRRTLILDNDIVEFIS